MFKCIVFFFLNVVFFSEQTHGWSWCEMNRRHIRNVLTIRSLVPQHYLRRKDDLLIHEILYWQVTFEGVTSLRDPIELLTSPSHSLKAEVRVKTVGFFTSLQAREETKLVTPWTNHLPSWPKQFRGPPESPWGKEQKRSIKTPTLFAPGGEILSCTSSFSCCSSHTLQPDTRSPPAHIMVLFTKEPHQSLRLQTLCSTTGSKACCSLSGIGPWAKTDDRATQGRISTSRQSSGAQLI